MAQGYKEDPYPFSFVLRDGKIIFLWGVHRYCFLVALHLAAKSRPPFHVLRARARNILHTVRYSRDVTGLQASTASVGENRENEMDTSTKLKKQTKHVVINIWWMWTTNHTCKGHNNGKLMGLPDCAASLKIKDRQQRGGGCICSDSPRQRDSKWNRSMLRFFTFPENYMIYRRWNQMLWNHLNQHFHHYKQISYSMVPRIFIMIGAEGVAARYPHTLTTVIHPNKTIIHAPGNIM